MTGNIYLDLTNEFNAGRLRAILSRNQALVLHGILATALYGDWIVREDDEALRHILEVLEKYGAKYCLGAPLDALWMRGGWSSHFEFNRGGNRIRCDFVSRPPRLGAEDLNALWQEQERGENGNLPVPTIDVRRLAHLKATQRERDYSFIGELARRMPDVRDQFLWSRSARDLIQLAQQHPEIAESLKDRRPLLAQIDQGRDALEELLDKERRELLRRDENRIAAYMKSARAWNDNWSALSPEIAGLSLRESHVMTVEQARQLLPEVVDE